MEKCIDELLQLYEARKLAEGTLSSTAGSPSPQRAGTYLTSSFAPRSDLPATASLRKMSNEVARRLAEAGMREPVSLEKLPNLWWKVNVDAAELGQLSEYGCAYVTQLLSSQQLALVGSEVIDGPFLAWESTKVSREILSANKGKYWDASISNRSLLPAVGQADLFAGQDDAYSSEALLSALDEGKTLSVYNGPFETAEEAHYALDLRWESPA